MSATTDAMLKAAEHQLQLAFDTNDTVERQKPCAELNN